VDSVLSLCSGIGGLDLGLHAGLRAVGRSPRTVCYVEREAFSVACLGAAIQEGRLDEAPIWCGDLRELPASQLPRIDWITGGYPCQPFSQAGKRAGANDPRHLWPAILELVRGYRPAGVLFENVAGHISLGLFDVLSDLEGYGYRTAWGCYSAASVGAPHRRERVFILGLADTDSRRLKGSGKRNSESSSRREIQQRQNANRCDAHCGGREFAGFPSAPGGQFLDEPPRTIKSRLGGNADGLPDRVDRLRALGNAVVPQQAEMAFLDLWRQLER